MESAVKLESGSAAGYDVPARTSWGTELLCQDSRLTDGLLAAMSDTLINSTASAESVDVLTWLNEYRDAVQCTVDRIEFADSSEWCFDRQHAALRHASGRFFAVQGYHTKSANGCDIHQPLINQPETGTQGFVVRRAENDFHVLVQARTEPGNIGLVQLGPTLQATYSNYTSAHGGSVPRFLDHFHHPRRHHGHAVLDTVQPELGSKFLRKWNRNVVIDSPPLAAFSHPMFRWVSLKTVAELMRLRHVVNNDARLVFGLLALHYAPQLFAERDTLWAQAVEQSFAASASSSFADVDYAQHWIEKQRQDPPPAVLDVPLADLPDREIGRDIIAHQRDLFFSIIQVRVHANDREVTDWDQPLIAARHRGEITLVCQRKQGVVNLLLRTESQIGSAHGAELQPTIGYDNQPHESTPPEIATLCNEAQIACLQIDASEEGGRFYQYANRYRVCWLHDDVETDVPPDYCWLTLHQIRALVGQTDFVSDEARSVISLLLAAAYCE